MLETHFPRQFLATGWHIGIKAQGLDFGVLHSTVPATAAAVFTRNNFPGNPVIVGREHVAGGKLQTVIVNSGNSNVATGPTGLAIARESCVIAAGSLGIAGELVLPSSTGVIGRPLPADKLYAACAELKERLRTDDFATFADAIRTTDAYRKLESRELRSGIRITGVAKGAGMIAPNMATMLCYVATDAEIDAADAGRLFRALMDRTLNRISVDSDTSTSDTAVLLANGASGVRVRFPAAAWQHLEERVSRPPEEGELESLPDMDDVSREFVIGLYEVCARLARLIVADGEGATKVFEVRVTEARDRAQALKIARSIVDSPLVKTAIYGADPNWGRLVMAVGKVFDEPVDPARLQIYFGDRPLRDAGPEDLRYLSHYLKNSAIVMRVSLGQGGALDSEVMWGCDLTEAYVRLNSEYTT